MWAGGVYARVLAFVSLVGLTACGASPSGGEPDAQEKGAVATQALVAAPTLTSFSPVKAVQGTTVTLAGSGFVNGATVAFNGLPAAVVTYSSSTRLKAVVPAGATSGTIRVTVPAGSATSATPFVVLPKITSVDPLHAFVGDFVTITGSGLTATTGVKLGTLSAAFALQSDSSISAAVPAGFVSGKVTVVTPGGNAASTTTVTALPLVTSFSPTEGIVGASVDIAGEGFASASAVKLGTKAASFSILSDTQIRAVVPVGAVSGKFTVETPKGNRTSAGTFTVIKLPVVSSFTPAASELPITLTVNGQNFVAVSAVKVGAVNVPFTLVNTKQLTADVPLGTPSGKVSVVNPAGAGSSSASFVAIACADADSDGVCDRNDRCPGFDDHVDSDADGLADGCDVCPSASSAGQSCGAGLACDNAGACIELECNASASGTGVLRGDLVIDGVDTAGDLAKLAGKWCVTGDVTLSRTALTDFSGLSSLVEVGGNLRIGVPVPYCSYPCVWGNGAVTSLHGLEQLRRIGGQLELQEQPGDPGLADLAALSGLKHLGSLSIDNALSLQNLHGLEGVAATGDVRLQSMDHVTSLAGLQNLATATNVSINQAPLLADISALSKLTSTGNLSIYGTAVSSLHGLENLTSVYMLDIGYDAQLASLDALSGLTQVTYLNLQNLNIGSLSALSQVQGLQAVYLVSLNVTTLDGLGPLADGARVAVNRCPNLTTLAGLGTSLVSDLKLTGNDSLQDCGALTPTADAQVEITQSEAFSSLGCLRGVSTVRRLFIDGAHGLTSFDDLAALTHVESDLVLWGAQVSTLAPLSNLTSAGNMTVGNLNLLDLHGLENLTQLQSLSLRYNLGLRSLHELSSLTQVGYVDVENNWNLSQCEIDWLGTQIGRPVDYNIGNGEACAP